MTFLGSFDWRLGWIWNESGFDIKFVSVQLSGGDRFLKYDLLVGFSEIIDFSFELHSELEDFGCGIVVLVGIGHGIESKIMIVG